MKIKRRWESFWPYDGAGIARHLAVMAQRGWQLQSLGPSLWTYRKAAPCALDYAVVYAARDDGERPALERAYREAGWQLAAEDGRMLIFCATDGQPVEVYEEQQLQAIHRQMKSPLCCEGAMMLLWGVLAGLNLYWLLMEPMRYLASNMVLGLPALLLAAIVYFAVEMLHYWRWYRQSEQQVAAGGQRASCRAGRQCRELLYPLMLLIVLVMLLDQMGDVWQWKFSLAVLAFFGAIAAVIWLTEALRKRLKQPAWVLAAVTVAVYVLAMAGMFRFMGSDASRLLERTPAATYTAEEGGAARTWPLYDDPLPLTIEDLMPLPEAVYSYEAHRDRSPLAASCEGWQKSYPPNTGVPILHYVLTDVASDFWYDRCLQQYLTDKRYRGFDLSYQPLDAPVYPAEAMWQRGYREYLIGYPGRIAQISFGWPASDREVAEAVRILGQEQP